MNIWKVTIEAIIMDANADNVKRTTTETLIPANSRGGAINVGLDMGQAMARSVNVLPHRLALYFRVINVIDTGEPVIG